MVEETERKGGREEGKERIRREGGWVFRLIFKYKRTCTNRIASRHCAPIFTVIVTGSGTTPWQGHPFEICRYKGSPWENKASTMRSEIKTNGVWEAGNSGERGRRRWRCQGGLQTHALSAAAWGINHCRELHNQVLPIRAHSETRGESSRQLAPHSKRNTLTALGQSYLARVQNLAELHNASWNWNVYSIIHFNLI